MLQWEHVGGQDEQGSVLVSGLCVQVELSSTEHTALAGAVLYSVPQPDPLLLPGCLTMQAYM